MNAAANPAVVIAGLTAWIHNHSNDSVTAIRSREIFESIFCGNKVLVEYRVIQGFDPEINDYQDIELECFWFAGQAFEFTPGEVADEQLEKWQKEALSHAIKQGADESLSVAINILECTA